MAGTGSLSREELEAELDRNRDKLGDSFDSTVDAMLTINERYPDGVETWNSGTVKWVVVTIRAEALIPVLTEQEVILSDDDGESACEYLDENDLNDMFTSVDGHSTQPLLASITAFVTAISMLKGNLRNASKRA